MALLIANYNRNACGITRIYMSKEKNRKLSKAEERRLANFDAVKANLINDGYTATELTVGIVKANVYAIIAAVPISALSVFLFFLKNKNFQFEGTNILKGTIIFLISFIILIVVHELIHGITWGLFAPEHFKDIEFGFMKEYLTPYCTCKVQLKKGQYILGALMPLITLGLIPTLVAIFSGSFLLLVIGIIMIISAGGDILIVIKLLCYKSTAKDILIFDHPTQAGSVIFEK